MFFKLDKSDKNVFKIIPYFASAPCTKRGMTGWKKNRQGIVLDIKI